MRKLAALVWRCRDVRRARLACMDEFPNREIMMRHLEEVHGLSRDEFDHRADSIWEKDGDEPANPIDPKEAPSKSTDLRPVAV